MKYDFIEMDMDGSFGGQPEQDMFIKAIQAVELKLQF
jgi:hypothetical protein